MTVDQLLYVAARIHKWDASAFEIGKRAWEIVFQCETAICATQDVEKKIANGGSISDLLNNLKNIASVSLEN